MRTLQVALSFESGGRREAIATLARGLSDLGTHCELACVDELGCVESVVDAVFIEWAALHRESRGNRAAVDRLVELIDDRKIDLIHSHDAASQWIAAKAVAKRRHVKLLMTFHRSLGFESAGWKAKLRNAIAGRATSAIIVGSRERGRHFLGENYVPARKVVRIPFGIDVQRFRPDSQAHKEVRQELGVGDSEVLVGAVGHFGEEKGIDIAIEGFAEFCQRCPESRATLAVVGRGNEEQESEMRRRASAMGQRVVFLGFRRDVERVFAAMDVFLHVPRLEAFGLVVAEAMACGVPVIGSEVGGVPDMVRQGVTGALVPVGDADAIASTLCDLVTNSSYRSRLGSTAQEIAQTEYSESLYVRRHMELYQDILQGRPPRGVDDPPAGNETGGIR